MNYDTAGQKSSVNISKFMTTTKQPATALNLLEPPIVLYIWSAFLSLQNDRVVLPF